jgi:hypothetical protein
MSRDHGDADDFRPVYSVSDVPGLYPIPSPRHFSAFVANKST